MNLASYLANQKKFDEAGQHAREAMRLHADRASSYGLMAALAVQQDLALVREFTARQVGLVCNAGFMRILSPAYVRAFAGRAMNIHPSLLPAFPGLHAQRQALEYGAKVAGATVHFVDEGPVDTGPIILQASVPVHPDDTEDSLSARILVQEHRLYPEAVRLFAEGRLAVVGRRVIVR